MHRLTSGPVRLTPGKSISNSRGREPERSAGLIAQFQQEGCIHDRRGAPAKPIVRRYTREDVLLLAEVDALHGTLSGPATRKLCERAFVLFGDERFVRLASISNGHLYNLRHAQIYQWGNGKSGTDHGFC